MFEDEGQIQWLRSRLEHQETRVTRIERLLMTEGIELFTDAAAPILMGHRDV
jgi:hypothetical protein